MTRTQTAADAKYANYTAKKAFLFPGQGAQSVGMAKVCTQAVRRQHQHVGDTGALCRAASCQGAV